LSYSLQQSATEDMYLSFESRHFRWTLKII
jgi:hypothetical protein